MTRTPNSTAQSATATPAVQAPLVPAAVQSALSPDEIVILVLRPSLLYIPLSSLGTQAFVALMKLLRTLRIL